MMRPDDSPGAPTMFSQNRHQELLLSDRDRDRLSIQRQHDTASQLLDVVGNALEGADRTLTHLEADPDLLPTAILRRCTELADLVGNLAGQLERQSPNDRERLADAIHNDVRRHYQQQQDLRQLASNPDRHELHLSSTLESDPLSLTAPNHVVATDVDSSSETQSPLVPEDGLNRNDILDALAGVVTLLRDVEASLRDVEKDDADEIADVAITFARLFIMSLQNIHATITPDDVLLLDDFNSNSRNLTGPSRTNTVIIEELSDDEDDETDRMGRSSSVSGVSEIDESAVPGINGTKNTRRRPSTGRRQQHVRVLWPRLGPHVETAMAWTKEEATKRPILAVALGLTLWPVAITTALIGGGAVLVDGMVQDAYNHFHDAPLINSLEQGAAQVYQAGRLSVLTGKLVVKQTLRVASRQIERQGGLQPVLENIGAAALDRVVHPIETAEMIWGGLNWGVGVVKENVDKILSHRQEEQVAQELQ